MSVFAGILAIIRWFASKFLFVHFFDFLSGYVQAIDVAVLEAR